MEERATASPNSSTLAQLCEAFFSKLIEVTQGSLPSKQLVARSSRARDATEAKGAPADAAELRSHTVIAHHPQVFVLQIVAVIKVQASEIFKLSSNLTDRTVPYRTSSSPEN